MTENSCECDAHQRNYWAEGKSAIAEALAAIRRAEALFRQGGHLNSLHLCCRFRRVAIKIESAIADA